MILTKPDYFELDFYTATRVLHAREAQHLRRVRAKMGMEKGRRRISALGQLECRLSAEDRFRDHGNFVKGYQDFH